MWMWIQQPNYFKVGKRFVIKKATIVNYELSIVEKKNKRKQIESKISEDTKLSIASEASTVFLSHELLLL